MSLIYGLHTCKAALNSNKYIVKTVYLLKGKRYPEWVLQYKNVIKYLGSFNSLFNTKIVHQGIAIEIQSLSSSNNLKKNSNLKDLDLMNLGSMNLDSMNLDLKNLRDINEAIAILDNVTDPHNVGAIIRSAAVFGIKAIIMQNRNSCKISGIVAKTASGGLEHVDIYNVTNLSTAIKELKKYGFWIISLAESGDKYLHELDLKGKICLILGSEGKGIRRLQLENSDFIAKLPSTKNFSTLNVSNAAAISFYEVYRQGGRSGYIDN